MRILSLASLTLIAATPAALGQSNVVPGRDATLSALSSFSQRGHEGTFPNGSTGLSMATTVCNTGTASIPWRAPMNADHPMIAFLAVRENAAGRLEQISDYSYVKHGFFATNSFGCGPCAGGPSSQLGVDCSDTYSTGNNGNRYYLGPPSEIDAWLGEWANVCSHFDRGEPAVAPPNDCDGVRSLTNGQANALGPVAHRVTIKDQDLNPAGGVGFAYQAQYVVRAEAEANRGDNLGWRSFAPNWNGSNFVITTTSTLAHGSVLDSWTGATVSSAVNANGSGDGRVYVGVTATDTGADNTWHYEIALHNRDNSGGIDGIRIPIPAGANVSGAGMRDLDGNAANDWTSSVVGDELVFTGPTNALLWNTVYNVWFDVDAEPGAGSMTLEQAGGLPDFAVDNLLIPESAVVAYCTSGTSASGCTALLSSTGTPSATASSGFVASAATVEGNKDGQFYFGSNGQQGVSWGNGTSYRCVVPPTVRAGLLNGTGTVGACDGSFSQDMNTLWVVTKPAKNPGAGSTVQLQFWYRDPQSTSNQTTSFSDALEFTLAP